MTPTATPTDAELVELLRKHPAEGMAALYDRYGRLVFSVALRVVQDRGAAEEITQDVFLRCWRNIASYRAGQGSLAVWLLSITRNRAVDELRSRRNKEARREISNELLEPASNDLSFDETLLRSEVERALHGLPSAQRTVIELVFWGGLSRREVADQLDLPLGTVHTRLRLAMDKLRILLSTWFAEE